MGKTLPFGEIKLASLQRFGISAELLFRRSAILNIQTRSIPLNDVAVCVAKWHFAVEHPAVFSIRSADASFVFEDFSGCETGSPLGHNSINVLRMNESGPIPAGHFVQSDAQVFQPRFIEVIEVAVRPGGVYQRRDRVDEKLNIQRLGFWSRGGHGWRALYACSLLMFLTFLSSWLGLVLSACWQTSRC